MTALSCLIKKLLFIIIVLNFNFNLLAQQLVIDNFADTEVIDLEALFDSIALDSLNLNIESSGHKPEAITEFRISKLLEKAEPVKLDSNFLRANPLLLPLVYKEKQNDFSTKNLLKYDLYLGKPPSTLESAIIPNKIVIPTPEQIVNDLRENAYRHFVLYNPEFFVYKQKQLPNAESVRNRTITVRNLDDIRVHVHNRENKPARIEVPKIIVSPWTKKANTMLQFSQNFISNNWHQGGSSNVAVLGVLSGQMNYDNKKNIQYDNSLEWRLGAYWTDDFLTDPTVIKNRVNVNNDLFRINSKFGFKMAGNWFYSASAEFSTQFADNFKSIRDTIMKARFLTPVRLNVGIGVDYKYQKLFSIVLSPLAWKYIYVNDTINVERKLFGIEAGKNYLSDIGSSFTAQLNYQPVKEIQIDTKLKFFTNYEKIETDWEIIGNFSINRYLSTRLAINLRYDNTPILKNPEDKAKIQFKELLSFGVSYKFWN